MSLLPPCYVPAMSLLSPCHLRPYCDNACFRLTSDLLLLTLKLNIISHLFLFSSLLPGHWCRNRFYLGPSGDK